MIMIPLCTRIENRSCWATPSNKLVKISFPTSLSGLNTLYNYPKAPYIILFPIIFSHYAQKFQGVFSFPNTSYNTRFTTPITNSSEQSPKSSTPDGKVKFSYGPSELP